MKNLANCSPEEFLCQGAKIKRAVQKWIDVNEIMEIRRTPISYPDGATAEERAKVAQEQGMKNLSLMFDNIAEKHPKETIDLMALCCFIDPKEANAHPMSDYMDAFTEMVNDKTVLNFFGSLVRLVQMFSPIA